MTSPAIGVAFKKREAAGKTEPVASKPWPVANPAARWQWARAVRRSPDLSGNEKIVAAQIADDFRAESGAAYTSHARLAAMCGIGEATARRCLEALLRAGWLRKDGARGGRRRLEDGRLVGRTNTYRLAAPVTCSPLITLEGGNLIKTVDQGDQMKGPRCSPLITSIGKSLGTKNQGTTGRSPSANPSEGESTDGIESVKAGKDVTIRIGRALSRLYGFDHRTRINDLHVDMWCGAELRRRGLWDELIAASVAKRLDDAMIDRAVAALPSLKELAS